MLVASFATVGLPRVKAQVGARVVIVPEFQEFGDPVNHATDV
jgi:hypothetical protein